MSTMEGILHVIKTQAYILDDTEVTNKVFEILMKCYEDLVDLEMELDEG